LVKGIRASIEEFVEKKIGSKKEGKRNRARGTQRGEIQEDGGT
jgi:hypothetical protein